MPSSKATLSLVPTPSQEETRTGLGYFWRSREKRPPKPPISERTCLLKVLRASILIRCLARSPEVMSTPASAYETDGLGAAEASAGETGVSSDAAGRDSFDSDNGMGS